MNSLLQPTTKLHTKVITRDRKTKRLEAEVMEVWVIFPVNPFGSDIQTPPPHWGEVLNPKNLAETTEPLELWSRDV